MSASDEPIVILRVEAEHDDGTFCVERKAPELPPSVTWHAGMWWSDEVDAMKVDSVWADQNGCVTVHFHERYRSPISDDSKMQFTKCGWVVSTT